MNILLSCRVQIPVQMNIYRQASQKFELKVIINAGKFTSLHTAVHMRVINMFEIHWNLDLTKSLGTGQIRSLNRGSDISRFFFINFTITYLGQRIPFVVSRFSFNRGSLNRGSTVRRRCFTGLGC